MIELWLLRHSLTEGNLKKRYIGTTDEPLCQEGRALLSDIQIEGPEILFCSPMKRCQETAEILFPDLYTRRILLQKLKECDFGEFENKNYLELSENKNYQAWIDSGGTMPFPGGESKEQCRERNLTGFEQVIQFCISKKIKKAAVVVHGGTIMNIMECYAEPKKSFYDWHVQNGHGYRFSLDEKKWIENEKKIENYQFL